MNASTIAASKWGELNLPSPLWVGDGDELAFEPQFT
jgi:hypothetical protein